MCDRVGCHLIYWTVSEALLETPPAAAVIVTICSDKTFVVVTGTLTPDNPAGTMVNAGTFATKALSL